MNKIILLILGMIVFLPAQDTTVVQTAAESTVIGSWWEISQKGGGIGYVIFGVLAVGLFLIFLQMLNLLTDYIHSKDLRKTNFLARPIDEIEELVTKKKNSFLNEMIARLLSFHKTSSGGVDMHQEVQAFIDQKIEKYEAFKSRLNFLSDSAGALGLLGTVYGVFLTFFGGELDSEKILNGMGVALITTLLGLVVSLIINFFGTEINSAFQSRMELLLQKGDELRLRLFQDNNCQETEIT